MIICCGWVYYDFNSSTWDQYFAFIETYFVPIEACFTCLITTYEAASTPYNFRKPETLIMLIIQRSLTRVWKLTFVFPLYIHFLPGQVKYIGYLTISWGLFVQSFSQWKHEGPWPFLGQFFFFILKKLKAYALQPPSN